MVKSETRRDAETPCLKIRANMRDFEAEITALLTRLQDSSQRLSRFRDWMKRLRDPRI